MAVDQLTISDEQMLGLDLRMVERLGQLLRADVGFLCFLGVLVEIHCCTHSYS